MSRLYRVLAVVFALALTLGSATAALAQDEATPDAESDPGSLFQDPRATPEAEEAGGDVPAVGDTVTLFSSETGDEVAAITVEQVVDGFDEFDEFYTPEEGTRVVAVEMTVENLVANDRYEFYSYDYVVSSLDGFLYSPTFVYLAEDVIEDYPEIPSEPILGGESASGWLFFAVPEDAEIEGLYYNTYDRFTLLAFVAEGDVERPDVGDTVTLVSEEGEDVAAITVDEVIDEFDEFDEFFTAEVDVRYVAVHVGIENLVPNDRFEVYTYNFRLVTTEGVALTPTYVSLPEDTEYAEFEETEILGGESADGYIFYAVPEDAELSALYYGESFQALALADLG